MIKVDLKEILKDYPTKDDLRIILLNYPTKQDLKDELANYVTNAEFRESHNTIMTMLYKIMKELVIMREERLGFLNRQDTFDKILASHENRLCSLEAI